MKITKFYRLYTILLYMVLPLHPAYAAWVSPTSTNSPARWSNNSLAIDQNSSTYASYQTSVGWGNYLEMYLPSPINYVDRVKVKADLYVTYSPECEIQLRVNSVWVSKYQGIVADAQFDEVTFSSENNVDAVRFRWRFTINNWNWWLYEMYVWEGQAPEPPACASNDATSVNTTSANLHGTLNTDGGQSCSYRFEYGLTTAYGNATSWTGNKVAGENFATTVTGLTSGQTYHFRAQAKNDYGTASGADKVFSTGAISSGWVSPTTFSDGGGWSDEEMAYDDETSSYAWDYHALDEPQWNNFLTLILPYAITSDRLRYYAMKSNEITTIDVDVSNGGGTWTDVYSGSFTTQTWETKTFTQRTVDRVRVRFQSNCTSCTFNYQLFEIDVNKVSSNTPTLAWTGETNYTTDGLHPETGYSYTDFAFRVQYTDADNDGPSTIQVWVDRNGDGDYLDSDEKINLSVASDAAPTKRDGTYTNGEVFSSTINITYGPSTSNCSYRFYANDGTSNATGTPTTPINYPDVLATPSMVSPVWSQSALGSVNGGAITESSIYLGTNNSNAELQARYISNGSQKWSYNAPANCNDPSYIYNGSNYIVLASAGTYVIGVRDNGATKTDLFEKNVNATAGNPYASPDGSTFYVTYANTISRRNLNTGNPSGDPGWPVTLTGVDISADIVVFNDEIYTATTGGVIFKIDEADGTPLGSYSIGTSVSRPLHVYGSNIYVAPDNASLYALNKGNMTLVSNFPVSLTAPNSGALFNDGSTEIFIAAGNCVQKATINGGSTSWTYNTGATVNSGPIGYNGFVYFGRTGGRYYALNSTGALVADWPYTSASGDANAGPWIDRSNLRVIFATTGGNLDAFALY